MPQQNFQQAHDNTRRAHRLDVERGLHLTCFERGNGTGRLLRPVNGGHVNGEAKPPQPDNFIEKKCVGNSWVNTQQISKSGRQRRSRIICHWIACARHLHRLGKIFSTLNCRIPAGVRLLRLLRLLRLKGSRSLCRPCFASAVTLVATPTPGALNPPTTSNKGRIIDPFSKLSIADMRIAAARALRISSPSGAPRAKGVHKTRATGSNCRDSRASNPANPYMPKRQQPKAPGTRCTPLPPVPLTRTQ